MKILSSGFYTDGFNVEQIRCWELSKACACGCFDREFYYMYCFLYAMHRGWLFGTEDSAADMLAPLGLGQETYAAENETDLLEKIHTEIDRGHPVMLALRYDTIYFNSLYRQETKMQHGMLITGYDAGTKLLNLKDYLPAREFAKTVIPRKTEVFIDYRIPEGQLLGMWRENREQGINELVVLKKESAGWVRTYKDLLRYFLEKVEIKHGHYTVYYDMKEIDYENVRKRLYNSIYMMLDVVRRALDREEAVLQDAREQFVGEMKRVLRDRNACTSLVIRDLMKYKKISRDTMEHLLENDRWICRLLQSACRQMEKEKTPRICLPNLALCAAVMCDSQKGNALAEYALNGKDDDTCWLSDYRYEEHWLTVDLKEETQADRFIVKHHPTKKNLVTRAFRIEGSSDLENWTVLFGTEDNDRHVSVIETDRVCFRYFRLYIEQANIIEENAARIYSFEIYDSGEAGGNEKNTR